MSSVFRTPAPAACLFAVGVVLSLVPAARGYADRVDDIVASEMATQHIPGAAIAVLRNGQIIRFGGYGVTDVDLRTPVSARTAFQIASISKQFLAAGIMI